MIHKQQIDVPASFFDDMAEVGSVFGEIIAKECIPDFLCFRDKTN